MSIKELFAKDEIRVTLTVMDADLIQALLSKGITTIYFDLSIPLSMDEIDEIFKNAKEQFDYWQGLYEKIFPKAVWQLVDKIGSAGNRYPRVTDHTNQYIIQKAVNFDTKHHPNALCGGMWVQKGFGGIHSDDGIYNPKDFTVYLTRIKVTFKNANKD